MIVNLKRVSKMQSIQLFASQICSLDDTTGRYSQGKRVRVKARSMEDGKYLWAAGKVMQARQLSLVDTEYASELLSYGSVAFTRSVFEPAPVEYRHASSPILDQSGLLEVACHQAHT
jgi:hypothetical protein